MSISILGINIKKIREEKGLSAYKLAQLAKVGNATISEIESGVRQSLNTSTVEKIANALGVSANDLFATEDNVEYIVTDIEQAMTILLSSDELVLDDIELNDTEKQQLSLSIDIALNSIRHYRDALGKVKKSKIIDSEGDND